MACRRWLDVIEGRGEIFVVTGMITGQRTYGGAGEGWPMRAWVRVDVRV